MYVSNWWDQTHKQQQTKKYNNFPHAPALLFIR